MAKTFGEREAVIRAAVDRAMYALTKEDLVSAGVAAKAALEAQKERMRWAMVGATSREDYERILRGEK